VRQLVEGVLRRAFPAALAVRHLGRRIARPVTVGVRALIIEREQVLLIRTHGSQKWTMPGGGVKRGEALREAAEREAWEETGCKVESGRLLGIYINVHEGMTNHVAVFVCRPLNPPTGTFNLEIVEARYWPINALPPTVSSGLRRRLDEYATGRHGIDQWW
jgi:ADP-ribose pyrophosphatase YjhB (NUDIX family)